MGSFAKSYEERLPNIQYEEMRKNLAIYMRRPLVIYEFAPDPF
jgi:hypothetical protein